MAESISLPELGTGAEPIRVGCWLVEPGDAVEFEDRVVEVLVQGITFDVPAPAAGILNRIDRPVDSVVMPGEVLGWIDPVAKDGSSN